MSGKYTGKIKRLLILAFLMVCLFLVPQKSSYSKESFVAGYTQTVYNQNNGIGSNEVNCLYQSSLGYIWIGTDGGLYRSNGADFQSINLWDTDRADVYSINCISQEKSGRLWIGTDNYGLFYTESGKNYHLQDEYYNGIKTIYDISITEEDEVYVATPEGIYHCVQSDGEVMKLEALGEESKKEFYDIEVRGDELWAIDNSNKAYIFKNGSLKFTIDTSDIVSDNLNVLANIDNNIYVGTEGREVICFKNRTYYSVYTSGVEGINNITRDNRGYIWICADNGIGYFDNRGYFERVNNCEIDSYLSDMIQDYEGNYWIASSRMGALLLCRSKFVDFNMNTGMDETIVNCVYKKGKNKYIGSDDGLFIYDSENQRVSNELTDALNGVSVRDIVQDKKGNLWVGTYRRYGLVKCDKEGKITFISRGSGLPGNTVNRIIVLDSGNLAVATDRGIAIVDTNGNVQKVYSDDSTHLYTNITCILEREDGTIFVGTDGEGLFEIQTDTDEIKRYTTEDGLNSNFILSMTNGENGTWIGTDSGLCFYKNAFRQISNIEVSNSVYDVIIDKENVWLVTSMGVLRTNEEELLGSDGISTRYFDANDGLSKTVNMVSKSYIDDDGLLYVCCNTGICTLDTRAIPYNLIQPKIKVTSISIDGKTYEFDDLSDGLKVKSDSSRITIDFAIFSYGNRSNIMAEYYLEGFDEEPIVLHGNDTMQAVYTNLDGGVYNFVINAYNGDGTPCESKVSFVIEKEAGFFEKDIAKVIIALVVIAIVSALFVGFILMRRNLLSKNSAIEKLSKEHEEAIKSSSAKNDYLANMSNEIKTPINAMVTKAGELLQLLEEDKNKQLAKEIYDAGADILYKVDDIILLAKIEAGKLSEVKAPYSITTLMYELSEAAMDTMSGSNVKFFIEIGEEITDSVIGDANKIKDILGRLIDNAMKYTKMGSITFSVDSYEYGDREHQDVVNVVFTVSDTGIGIQEDRIDTIFEVYNIADNMKGNQHSGNGLGLAIAKGYADILGADIEVESSYGAGSTFTLSLNQKIAGKMSSNYPVTKIEAMVSAEEADKLWLPDVYALVVEDDEISREVIVKALSRLEMRIDCASTGMAALDMVMNNDYDVVFLDLSMPVMSGMDVMREIRELSGEKYMLLPVIALETDAIDEHKETLLESGFTDSILKPIEPRRVAAILKDCLPQSKIKERSNNIEQYIEGSRYRDGLLRLGEVLDIENAIEKIGGNIEVYNKLVVAFFNQNNNISDELFGKIDKDVRGLKIKIHSIRTASVNIGAYNVAHEASKIEAAINIGNKEYVRDNLNSFNDELLEILLFIEDYIDFLDTKSGTGEEDSSKKQTDIQDRQNKNESIDIKLLENIKYAALEGDFENAQNTMNTILTKEYTGEDKEFIEVLKQAVDKKDVPVIDELIGTYMDLKL